MLLRTNIKYAPPNVEVLQKPAESNRSQADLQVETVRQALYLQFSDHKLRTTEVSNFSWQRSKPSRSKKLPPGIRHILGLLPAECVIVLINSAIIDLHIPIHDEQTLGQPPTIAHTWFTSMCACLTWLSLLAEDSSSWHLDCFPRLRLIIYFRLHSHTHVRSWPGSTSCFRKEPFWAASPVAMGCWRCCSGEPG